MSHFFCVVLVPSDTKDIREKVEELLAPYSENLEVEPYTDTDGELTTYNPKSKWDWWRIGGRYDGYITANRQSSEDGFNFNARHETIKNNCRPVKELPENLVPYAIVSPDGEWHAKGEMGWWGMSDDTNEATWPHNSLMLFGNNADCLAIGCDLHI